MSLQPETAVKPTLKLRKKRIPVSGSDRSPLSVRNKDPQKVYRWVNVSEERMERFIDGGYEPVRKGDIGPVGDTKVDTSQGTSSVVEKGVGLGKKAILMSIDKEFYDEDQKAKSKRVDAIEATIKRDAHRDRYGKLDISHNKPE